MEESTEINAPKKKLMLEALEKSLGVVTTAAKMAGIERTTHYSWTRSTSDVYDPVYTAAVKEIEYVTIDFVESKLHKRINGFSEKETKTYQHRGKIITHDIEKVYPPDPSCIQFYLATKGKERGYVKRIETEEVGEPKPMRVVIVRSKDDLEGGE